MKRKRKSSLSTSDKLIMGSGYVLLAMFVLVILSLIHISEPTRLVSGSRMPSSA